MGIICGPHTSADFLVFFKDTDGEVGEGRHAPLSLTLIQRESTLLKLLQALEKHLECVKREDKHLYNLLVNFMHFKKIIGWLNDLKNEHAAVEISLREAEREELERELQVLVEGCGSPPDSTAWLNDIKYGNRETNIGQKLRKLEGTLSRCVPKDIAVMCESKAAALPTSHAQTWSSSFLHKGGLQVGGETVAESEKTDGCRTSHGEVSRRRPKIHSESNSTFKNVLIVVNGNSHPMVAAFLVGVLVVFSWGSVWIFKVRLLLLLLLLSLVHDLVAW